MRYYTSVHQDPEILIIETAKPSRMLNMPNRIRANPIEMTVEYLDFRSELNAFDKFFYFLDF